MSVFPINIRNELTKIQYGDLDENLVIETLEQNNISVGKEDLTVHKVSNDSGFDGAAVHVKIEKNNKEINEVYYFFRGTEDDTLHDAVYDITGIGAGVTLDQIRDAQAFYRDVETNIAEDHNVDSLTRYGDGHSLGGHLVINVALLEKDFTDVRGSNDAPVNLKQLATLDVNFRHYLYSYTGEFDITNIPPEKLQLLARDFYADEAKNISHTRVRGEPLYPQTIPNTMYIGNDIYYIGDPNTPEFPNVFDSSNTGSGSRFVNLLRRPFGTFYDLGFGIKVKADTYLYDFHIGRLMGLIGAMGEDMSVAEITEVIETAKDNPLAALQLIPDAEYARLVRTFGLSHLLEA